MRTSVTGIFAVGLSTCAGLNRFALWGQARRSPLDRLASSWGYSRVVSPFFHLGLAPPPDDGPAVVLVQPDTAARLEAMLEASDGPSAVASEMADNQNERSWINQQIDRLVETPAGNGVRYPDLSEAEQARAKLTSQEMWRLNFLWIELMARYWELAELEEDAKDVRAGRPRGTTTNLESAHRVRRRPSACFVCCCHCRSLQQANGSPSLASSGRPPAD